MTDTSNPENTNTQDPDGDDLATPTSSSADAPDVDPADLGATGGFTDATDTTPEGTPAADG